MGKNLSLDILLSRKSKHYRPGEVVSGECVLQLTADLKLRCVSIEFQGESWTYWEETEVYTTTHKNAEIYFHKKTALYGNSEKKKSETTVLSAGRHAFQFNFKIPPYSLPSSFESKHGYVRYWLKARIDRPWRFDVVTKEEVNILSVIDVNCPQMLLPSFAEAQKSLNCLHNGMASMLKLSAFADRRAYCARDHMVLSTDIENLPLTESYQTSVCLVQTISFKSRCGKTRTERYRHKIVQRPSLSWAVDELQLPDVPPTMKNCGILSIAYHIIITLFSCDPGAVPLLEVELPITIGTVPLQRSYGTIINKLVPVSRLSRSFSRDYKTFVTIKRVSSDSIAHCARVITA